MPIVDLYFVNTDVYKACFIPEKHYEDLYAFPHKESDNGREDFQLIYPDNG